MCGIAGIFSSKDISANYIKSMLEPIIHRGPDSEGIVSMLGNRCFLGHRRLSILDLTEAGKQPMSYKQGRYWITYNGEVFNYVELKSELEGNGYCFNTGTDTEVIMAAYDCWGKECLHKFNGMWAFIILDTIEQKIFVARDRFGVKPIYYWRSPEGFLALASEIKQFTVLPGWMPKVNGQRAYDFLKWGITDHTRETLFEDVYQIGAGEAVECGISELIKSMPVYKWYNLQARDFIGDFEEAAEEFRDIFTQSVALRLRSDVEVASCLSGGLDSSSIVCVVNDILKENGKDELQKTVSAGAAVSRYDESKYIDEVLKKRNIRGYYVYPEFETLFNALDDIVWHQDEPFGSTSIYAQWRVFEKAAEEKLTVMLDGQGADEQLAGYHAFFAPHFAGLFRRLQWLDLIQEINCCKKLHGYGLIFAIKGIVTELMPESVVNFLRNRYSGNDANPAWLDMGRLQAKPVNPGLYTGAKASSVKELSYSQLTASNLQMLLHYEDRDSMAHSVESRLPFLDYRLVEFVLGLPDEYKLSRGITKRVLRESMHGMLPEKIRLRMDKIGFATPEEVWARNNKESFRNAIHQSIESSLGIIKSSCLDGWNAIADNMSSYNFYIWRVICFGKWMERFNVGV